MHRVVHTGRRLAKTIIPAKVIHSRLYKHVFTQFADKIGLVYFGYVDQRDDHRLVRGFTVSTSHRDNHYCIGSFQNYDVTLVERADTIHFPGKATRSHDWTIMTFDLHTHVDLPHVFVGLHSQSETFYAHLFTKFSRLRHVPLGTFGAHDASFVNRYAIYTEPSQAIAVEKLLTKDITSVIARSFGNMVLEIDDSCLYLYAEHLRPTVATLERMLTCGVWLAQVIDLHAERMSQ